MRYTLEEFTNFLKTIDLDKYREQYSKTKIVEMDLPKNVQALDTIYNVYWNKDYSIKNGPLSFDDFYKLYFEEHKNAINDFWNKSGFGTECDCFTKGLKARIYRTWASIVTQIHAGYVAEKVFGEGTVKQSTEIDHKGIDIQVNYKQQDIFIQVKKESKRPEISRMSRADKDEDGYYHIWYVVPTAKDYNEPYYVVKSKAGQLRESVKAFVKFNPEFGTLDRLNNGFVVFTEKEFEMIKKEIQ